MSQANPMFTPPWRYKRPSLKVALSSGASSSARTVRNVTRSLMLMSGVEEEAFKRLRTLSKPVALAEACRVYCAVEARDSLTRRAIVWRTADILTPAAPAASKTGGRSWAGGASFVSGT